MAGGPGELPEGARLLIRYGPAELIGSEEPYIDSRIISLTAEERRTPDECLPGVIGREWVGLLAEGWTNMLVGIFFGVDTGAAGAASCAAEAAAWGAGASLPAPGVAVGVRGYRILASLTRAPPPEGTPPELAAQVPYVDLGIDYFSREGGGPRYFVLKEGPGGPALDYIPEDKLPAKRAN